MYTEPRNACFLHHPRNDQGECLVTCSVGELQVEPEESRIRVPQIVQFVPAQRNSANTKEVPAFDLIPPGAPGRVRYLALVQRWLAVRGVPVMHRSQQVIQAVRNRSEAHRRRKSLRVPQTVSVLSRSGRWVWLGSRLGSTRHRGAGAPSDALLPICWQRRKPRQVSPGTSNEPVAAGLAFRRALTPAGWSDHVSARSLDIC